MAVTRCVSKHLHMESIVAGGPGGTEGAMMTTEHTFHLEQVRSTATNPMVREDRGLLIWNLDGVGNKRFGLVSETLRIFSKKSRISRKEAAGSRERHGRFSSGPSPLFPTSFHFQICWHPILRPECRN